MSLNPPKATCKAVPAKLTIEIPIGGMWSGSRYFYYLIADAIGDKGIDLIKGGDTEDGNYMNSIADAVVKAIEEADKKNEDNIANIFG